MDSFLAETIRIAEHSLNAGGFPVGSIICVGGTEVGRGASSTEALNDVTAHAEVQAIRVAKHQSKGGILYTSLEPCMMCLAACAWAGIQQVVFACSRFSVAPSYYESNSSSEDLSRLLVRPIRLVPHLAGEAEVISLLRRWEEAYNH